MRVVETKIYKFDELSETARTHALNEVREWYLGDSCYLHEYVVDDCYLFEPRQEDIKKIFGANFKESLFTNSRKGISYDLDKKYVTFAEAIDTYNDENFCKWLGISKRTQKKIESFWFEDVPQYITALKLEFNAELTEKQKTEVAIAKDKWLKHTNTILERINSEWDYLQWDEHIEELIFINDLEFTGKGEIYND